jgi:hypothetical protein
MMSACVERIEKPRGEQMPILMVSDIFSKYQSHFRYQCRQEQEKNLK